MKEEIRTFFTALMFYTRIPCPSWVDHSEYYINRSIRYFPLIGWIVSLLGLLFFLAAYYSFGIYVSVIVYCIATMGITGAFHEDGLADVFDGFGGGWTKEQILQIMKDSRLGTFGVLGIVLTVLLKMTLLVEILELMPLQLFLLGAIYAHAMSRFGAATVVFTSVYARDDADSKSKPVAKSASPANAIISMLFAFVPLVVFSLFSSKPMLWLSIVPAGLVIIWMRSYFQKKIGGYTGDCLGAVQQVTEVVLLAQILLVWRFF